MKQLLKQVGTAPFRILPGRVRRWVVQLAMHATASQSPRAALRGLLEIDEDLTGLINEVALLYDDGVHAKHRLMRYHDFFVARVGRGERVLEVGCGYGGVAYSLASRAGAVVTGLDLDSGNIEKARRRFQHPALTFVEGTAPQDLPAGPFDVVVASNVLEHIDRRIEFLTTVQQRVAPDRWLIRVPMADRDWRVPLRKELGLPHFSDPTHFTEYTRESFEREMADARLTVRHLQVNWGEIWAEVACRA